MQLSSPAPWHGSAGYRGIAFQNVVMAASHDGAKQRTKTAMQKTPPSHQTFPCAGAQHSPSSLNASGLGSAKSLPVGTVKAIALSSSVLHHGRSTSRNDTPHACAISPHANKIARHVSAPPTSVPDLYTLTSPLPYSPEQPLRHIIIAAIAAPSTEYLQHQLQRCPQTK